MIRVTILRENEGVYRGFECIGHAAYAEEGQDIVCAGVSALVINTINSVAYFTKERFSTDSDEETGMISFRLEQVENHDAQLLMHSLVLGLQGIQNNYGNEYITLAFKEV